MWIRGISGIFPAWEAEACGTSVVTASPWQGMFLRRNPRRLVASLEIDKEFGTDRLGSVIMEFPSGQAHFGVSTQAALFQRMQILGDKGHLEVRIPFTPPIDQPTHIDQDNGNYLPQGITRHEYPAVNQYTLMGDDFSRAILEDKQVPVTLEDALNNTRVLTAVFKSAETGQWVEI